MDKLWSTRGSEQAAASLRQALHALRAALGNDALTSGSGWVGLDSSKIHVALEPTNLDVDGSIPEFAEGLDIPDPEFEDWIRDARQHFADLWSKTIADNETTISSPAEKRITRLAEFTRRPWSPRSIKLVLPSEPPLGHDRNALSDIILRDGAQRAAHMLGAEVAEHRTLSADAQYSPGSLRFDCQVAEISGRVVIQPTIADPISGIVLWQRTMSGSQETTQDLIDEATAAISSAAVTQVFTARRTATAPRLLDAFSFDASRLLQADQALGAEADNTERSAEGPVRLAYRAWLRHTMVMERLTRTSSDALEEASEMMRYAREAAPFNQFILAVDSLIHGARGEDELALELALEARRLDPNHAFVRKSLSVALSFSGHPKAAHEEAIAAGRNQMSPLAPAFFELRKAYTAIGINDAAGALRWAKAAIQRAPDLRAAHRVVAALQYADGNVKEAEASLLRLRTLEPDFSLDLMASDSYPVDSLRKAGLLSVTESGLL
ncbi:hypothetical protein [Pontivivens ytuae]|uniref:Tetratricopeptide repeat protein n=1 Tax=Pontivivens ytuae TaxID=2789856 RepID=A0A7S9LSJ3_9RHOB|nr:hypothetical protein [Pontivivens ytuae]QPH54509.1 hypothetical protein I0K15_01635 [Pontivivens ytuae]